MKLSSPLLGNLKITQTVHGHSATNPSDLRFQRAVDMYHDSTNDNVYAEADGYIQDCKNYGDHRSYIQPMYDGAPLPKQLVHAYPLKEITKGMRIKRGQRIGKLCESEKDPKTGKYTFLKHLHNTFYNPMGNGQIPEIFDYMDRSIGVYATNKEILATKWFKNGVFQWDLFRDLSLQVTLKKGNYLLTKEQWIKQEPNTKAPNFKKAPKGAIGTVTSGVISNGGYDWQYIVFGDTAGWIPNYVLTATDKPVTNILPKENPPLTEATKEQVDLYLKKNNLAAISLEELSTCQAALTRLEEIKTLANSELN